MIRYHEPEDMTKVAELAAAMVADGWHGAPLVTIADDELLTGSHRHAAWVEAFGDDHDIPTISLADVFAEAGIDLAAVMDDEGCEYIGDGYTVYVIEALPAETRDAYGIDIH